MQSCHKDVFDVVYAHAGQGLVPFYNRGIYIDSLKHTRDQAAAGAVSFSSVSPPKKAKVGLSARSLRQLFKMHVGSSTSITIGLGQSTANISPTYCTGSTTI